MNIRDGITFDDVLLIPKFSFIKSRSHVDLTVGIKDLEFMHPIIPANMKSIIGEDMIRAIYKERGLGIMHRFVPIEEQIEMAKRIFVDTGSTDLFDYIGFSIGVQDRDHYNVDMLEDAGVKIFCIDVAHGASKLAENMTTWIRNNYPDSTIIAGNVASSVGAEILWAAGADIVKVGVGGGSLCTTRVETGNGVPQLTALVDVYETRERVKEIIPKELGIISDGGIKSAGDMTKALCFSDMVMAGNVFAGCPETPGKHLRIGDNTYKEYVGSSTHKTKYVEGVSALVPTKSSFNVILQKMLDGIRSGCSYQGVSNLIDLKKNPEFVRITNSGLIESKPHNIIMV